MTEQTEPRVDVDALAGLLAAATPGVWKLWGMQVMADQDGTSNVDTAVPVAQTYFRDENGKPRTWDAALIASLVNAAPALLAEVAALRAKVASLRASIWNLGESIHGEEGIEHNEGCEGEPDCLACILLTLRAALADDTTTDRSTP